MEIWYIKSIYKVTNRGPHHAQSKLTWLQITIIVFIIIIIIIMKMRTCEVMTSVLIFSHRVVRLLHEE